MLKETRSYVKHGIRTEAVRFNGIYVEALRFVTIIINCFSNCNTSNVSCSQIHVTYDL
jgi:hypothetical protein